MAARARKQARGAFLEECRGDRRSTASQDQHSERVSTAMSSGEGEHNRVVDLELAMRVASMSKYELHVACCERDLQPPERANRAQLVRTLLSGSSEPRGPRRLAVDGRSEDTDRDGTVESGARSLAARALEIFGQQLASRAMSDLCEHE